jgi:hypothetical protein
MRSSITITFVIAAQKPVKNIVNPSKEYVNKIKQNPGPLRESHPREFSPFSI